MRVLPNSERLDSKTLMYYTNTRTDLLQEYATNIDCSMVNRSMYIWFGASPRFIDLLYRRGHKAIVPCYCFNSQWKKSTPLVNKQREEFFGSDICHVYIMIWGHGHTVIALHWPRGIAAVPFDQRCLCSPKQCQPDFNHGHQMLPLGHDSIISLDCNHCHGQKRGK